MYFWVGAIMLSFFEKMPQIMLSNMLMRQICLDMLRDFEKIAIICLFMLIKKTCSCQLEIIFYPVKFSDFLYIFVYLIYKKCKIYALAI